MKDSDKSVDGQSFYSEALTGSGTITPDGTYAEPEPDPTVKRGGPEGERTSPGGVKRPDPNEAVAPAQRTEGATSTTKPRNQRS
jgi:hypothetical protein